MERSEVRPPVPYVVMCVPCNEEKSIICLLTQYIRGFTLVWTRQEYYELVLDHRNMYPYVQHANNAGRKRHGFSVDIEIDLGVTRVVKIDLISMRGIGIDFISV